MLIHIIEGEAGCRYAASHGAAAIIVDALRASATASALFAYGAKELLVTSTVEEALHLKTTLPDAMLYGERGGVPPAGFDCGNSPAEAFHSRGKQVIFTTTTGACRLIQAWGSNPVLMASTINTSSVVQYLCQKKVQETVIVPAGLMDAPNFNAQEDWAASAHIAMQLCNCLTGQNAPFWGNGYERFIEYRSRIETEGLNYLFSTAPHAEKLRAIGKENDILQCAQIDVYDALPMAVEKNTFGVTVRNACCT